MPRPPVLLVHGYASSFERNWREPGWVDILTDLGREVIYLDLPGHGLAPKSYDPSVYVDLTSAITAVLPAQPVDAIGFSLGGTLVLAAAAQDPARFHRIVIGGVGASLFQRGDAEALARAVEIGSAPEDAGPEAAIFARFARAPGNDPMALAAFMRRPTERLTPAELATLSRPVLVVLGEHDFAGPAAPLLDALPDASYVEIRGLDHFGTPKDYRFIDAAVKFLETEDS